MRRPALPRVITVGWARNGLDRFVLAGLERAGLAPAPEADRRTLIRRLSLDLTGLPPTPQQLSQFVRDRRAGAYERLVERLLASPHFGERWGRHWLDLARYADSDGYEMDHARPHAWRWRDWVIDAINRDMPFDRFTIEQLAGDLLPGATLSQRTATGFHRNTLTNRENGIDKEEFRLKAVVDRVNTTGTVWLGLTLGCAECHDHKYDPISQREYYELFAFFNNEVDEVDVPVPAAPHEWEQYQRAKAEHAAQLSELEQRLSAAPDAQQDDLRKAVEAHKKEAPEPPQGIAYGFARRTDPRTTHVHIRGNFLDPAERVTPGTPRVLPALTRRHQDGRLPDRLDLARWIVHPNNPLTPRVAANHVWQHLFGVGLVATPEDFGTQGARPSHPELLDYLADEFVRRGWSRKALLRLVVTSATYRQSSQRRTDQQSIDPENRLLGRQNRFRLEAEVIRDQYLAASGLLQRRIGGSGFRPPLPAGLDKIGFRLAWRPDGAAETYRRGMYIFYHRNLAYPMLKTFNFPNSNVTCTRRERSNTPLQSLTQLNDPLLVAAALALATRLLDQPADGAAERLDRAFLRCVARRPTHREREVLLRLYDRLREIYRTDETAARALLGERSVAGVSAAEAAAWIALSRTIMNLDEFVTRE